MEADATAGSSPAAESTPQVEAVTTAVDQAVVAGDVSAYREARRAERFGKPLDAKAESSPAQPVEQAASTEVNADPASETGKPRKNAETRVQELLAERNQLREKAERAERLERELAELRRTAPQPDVKPAVSSPATAETFPSYDTYLQQHPDASYEDYIDARADFRADLRLKTAREQEVRERQQQELTKAQKERAEGFRQRIEAVKAQDPAFIDSLSADVKALKPFDALLPGEQPTAFNAIAEEILSSPVAPQLMRHFTDHPEDLQRLGAMTPTQLLKEMGKLEAKYADSAKPAPAPLKTVTDAPAPPTQLGTKPAAPADPVEAAVNSGDVAAFRAARLAQRTANLR